jgi:hypothetical protein
VQFADGLVGVQKGFESTGLVDVENIGQVGEVLNNIDHNTLRRLRKVTEVVEDDLDIGLGHSKFARIASTGATLTSVGAFALAGENLLISAAALDQAHAQTKAVTEIKDQFFYDFYGSICVFIAEGFLFATPINFRFAWKGTRYLTNRYLYTFRKFPKLYRLIMSEMHYAIRGIVPGALRAPEEAITYLTSVAAWTIQILREFDDLSIEQVPDRVADIVERYQAFVAETYEVAMAAVNVEAIIQSVVEFVSDDMGILSIPGGHDLSFSATDS